VRGHISDQSKLSASLFGRVVGEPELGVEEGEVWMFRLAVARDDVRAEAFVVEVLVSGHGPGGSSGGRRVCDVQHLVAAAVGITMGRSWNAPPTAADPTGGSASDARPTTGW
jgi:hypothetical protein